jgi:hypothetical protein
MQPLNTSKSTGRYKGLCLPPGNEIIAIIHMRSISVEACELNTLNSLFAFQKNSAKTYAVFLKRPISEKKL